MILWCDKLTVIRLRLGATKRICWEWFWGEIYNDTSCSRNCYLLVRWSFLFTGNCFDIIHIYLLAWDIFKNCLTFWVAFYESYLYVYCIPCVEVMSDLLMACSHGADDCSIEHWNLMNILIFCLLSFNAVVNIIYNTTVAAVHVQNSEMIWQSRMEL